MIKTTNISSSGRSSLRIAIQGELGSNSHMAAVEMLGSVDVLPCTLSAQVTDAVLGGRADAAVLPIENTLHGSVAEHYDLLMAQPLRIERESLLRVRHNLIAAPGVRLEDIRTILSHPVALAQCRRFLADKAEARALPFYDTAGSVRHIVEENLRDTAGIAPVLAAELYGGEVLAAGIEDHAQNVTRFHLLRREQDAPLDEYLLEPDKLTLAFTLEHRPGTLVEALSRLSEAGVNLTRIESRPVPGSPWEYVFFAEFRFTAGKMADAAVQSLRTAAHGVKELGRYRAAST